MIVIPFLNAVINPQPRTCGYRTCTADGTMQDAVSQIDKGSVVVFFCGNALFIVMYSSLNKY